MPTLFPLCGFQLTHMPSDRLFFTSRLDLTSRLLICCWLQDFKKGSCLLQHYKFVLVAFIILVSVIPMKTLSNIFSLL